MEMVQVNSSAIWRSGTTTRLGTCEFNFNKDTPTIFAGCLPMYMPRSCVPTQRALTTMNTLRIVLRANAPQRPNNVLNLAHFVRWTSQSCALSCQLA
jgi:hypothetical protein